jgi:hypothetical protein
MSRLKRISMAGSDVAVTDAKVADLVLEYAKQLGRANTTDTITLPVAQHGRALEASLLLGPASQIALTENEDVSLEAVALPRLEEVCGDLRHRIDSVAGRSDDAVSLNSGDEFSSFVDFDDF